MNRVHSIINNIKKSCVRIRAGDLCTHLARAYSRNSYNNYIKMIFLGGVSQKLIRFSNSYMYWMFNMIHTNVLKFIEHIIFINCAIFEGILDLIFIIKLFLKKQIFILYITIYF